MIRDDAMLGGEASGHVIFHNYHSTGDGIIAALQLLGIMRETGKPVSELAKVMKVFPQKLINFDVAGKPPLDDFPELRSAVRKAEAELGGKGRILIRYSGTQPMCRVMVEGPTEESTARIAEELVAVVRKCIS
jgi:phosphoglucosamine mutase